MTDQLHARSSSTEEERKETPSQPKVPTSSNSTLKVLALANISASVSERIQHNAFSTQQVTYCHKHPFAFESYQSERA